MTKTTFTIEEAKALLAAMYDEILFHEDNGSEVVIIDADMLAFHADNNIENFRTDWEDYLVK